MVVAIMMYIYVYIHIYIYGHTHVLASTQEGTIGLLASTQEGTVGLLVLYQNQVLGNPVCHICAELLIIVIELIKYLNNRVAMPVTSSLP